MRLGLTAEELLKATRRQPLMRGRSWRYCVREPRTDRKARNMPVFDRRGKLALIATTARSHRAKGVHVHQRVRKLRGARRAGKGIFVKRAGRGNSFVYGVHKGRVRYVALASKKVAKKRRTLRRYLRLAGVR